MYKPMDFSNLCKLLNTKLKAVSLKDLDRFLICKAKSVEDVGYTDSKEADLVLGKSLVVAFNV